MSICDHQPGAMHERSSAYPSLHKPRSPRHAFLNPSPKWVFFEGMACSLQYLPELSINARIRGICRFKHHLNCLSIWQEALIAEHFEPAQQLLEINGAALG